MKRKTKKFATRDAAVAVDRRATGSADDGDNNGRSGCENASPPAPGGRGLPRKATGRSRSEALKSYWRDVKSGARTRNEHSYVIPPDPEANPLLQLSDEESAKLFRWIRDCPYPGAVREILREKGLPEATNEQIDEFHQVESMHHWDFRAGRAAVEADALVQFVEKKRPQFSAAILARLGQETFRLLSRDDIDTATLNRIAALFLKTRNDERADQMQGLKRRKIEGELQGQLNQALGKLAEEAGQNSTASEALDILRRELAGNEEDTE